MQISCVDIKLAMWCPDSIFNRRVKPWSRFLPNFTYSIYRPGEQTIVSCSNWIRTLVAMANYSCHWLVMGKVEIGIYCCLTADMLIKVLQKCSLSSLLPNIWILSKPLNLIGCHGNRNIKFAKKYSKIISSEAIRGMKLKLYRNVTEMFIILASIKICFYYCCLCALVAMAT